MRAHTYESATGTPEEPGTLRVDAVGVAAGELDPLNRLINRVERTNQVRAARTPQVIVFSKTSGNPTMRKEISAILRMYKAESKLWLQAEGLVGDAVIDVYHAPDVDSVRVDLKFTPGWRTGDVLLLASNGATLVEDGFGGPNGPPARKG